MLLWLRYLKQLELACASVAELPPGGARDVKTMYKIFIVNDMTDKRELRHPFEIPAAWGSLPILTDVNVKPF
ncbi:unnamed protein product [Colias eurytheme]|nr:unnamed protein product [Colias eurytheme]